MICCELCGRQGLLLITIIENVKLNVCSNCKNFGQVTDEPKKQILNNFKRIEPQEVIIDDYNVIIKNKRQDLGLTQEEFARKLNQKTSLIMKIENAELKLDLETARKFEKILNIILITKEKYTDIASKDKKIEKLTIGDFLKK